MPSLALDGEMIVKYIKEVKLSEKVGVHGQSLGGSIAARLGKTTDFIFCDRTFRGLSDVALFSYGKIAYLAYKYIGPQETNPVQDFLSATSYKLLSCDSDDTMIPNLASLKSGVTFSIKNSEFKGLKIFSLAKPYREN